MIEKYTFEQFARRYCDRQDSTPQVLLETFRSQLKRFNCVGWFMLEAQLLDSSWMGSLVILPYGGEENTFKEVPTHPVSPRGLASDTSVAVAYILASELPESITFDWQPPPPPKKTKRKR